MEKLNESQREYLEKYNQEWTDHILALTRLFTYLDEEQQDQLHGLLDELLAYKRTAALNAARRRR